MLSMNNLSADLLNIGALRQGGAALQPHEHDIEESANLDAEHNMNEDDSEDIGHRNTNEQRNMMHHLNQE